jgi:DNA-binding Lrp family transcriptional regulator
MPSNNQRPVPAVRARPVRPRPADLDDVDRRLLELLAENARTPNARLAELAGIAPSTCVARIRSLVDRGVIEAFTVRVPPASLGLGLEALINVSIRTGARQRIPEFHADMAKLPEVTQVFFLAGLDDFTLHLAVRDTDDLREFVLNHLSAHPAVASTRTSLVFQHEATGPGLGAPGGAQAPAGGSSSRSTRSAR